MTITHLPTAQRSAASPRPTGEGLLNSETQELLDQLADCHDEDEERRLRNDLVLHNLRLARRLASRYANRGVPTEDLVQVASLALVKAVAAFDPLRSDTFIGYVVLSIRGDLKKHFRDHAWAIRPPRRLQELQLELKSELPVMAQESGAVPTQRALADRLNTAEHDVSEAMSLSACFSPTSLDRPTHEFEDSETLAERIPAVDSSVDRAEIRMLLAPLLADLTLRERRIVHLRFFCEWTQAKIAAELGVSQMQISRILKRILNRLRVSLDAQLAAG